MTSGGHFRKGIWGNINFAYSTNGHDFWESVCFMLMCKGWQAPSHIMVQPHLLPGHNKLLLQKLTWDKHGKCGLFCWWLCLLQMIYLRIHQRWGEWQWHLFAWPLSLGGSLLRAGLLDSGGESFFIWFERNDGLYSLPRLTWLWWGTEDKWGAPHFAHCQCLDQLISFPICERMVYWCMSFAGLDWTFNWNGGWHSFCFWVMSKERICSFHSSALPCGVLPLVPNALYSQMTLLNPCGQWSFVGPPFLWRAEQEVRVGAMWGGWLTFLWMSDEGFVTAVNELSWLSLFEQGL